MTTLDDLVRETEEVCRESEPEACTLLRRWLDYEKQVVRGGYAVADPIRTADEMLEACCDFLLRSEYRDVLVGLDFVPDDKDAKLLARVGRHMYETLRSRIAPAAPQSANPPPKEHP